MRGLNSVAQILMRGTEATYTATRGTRESSHRERERIKNYKGKR